MKTNAFRGAHRATYSSAQKITTTGNATLIAYDGVPVLATDPWIGDEEPAYFGSWVLSHVIPAEIKRDIVNSQYVWFSHGHPDHLNPQSLERFKSKKILLPDHLNSRICNDFKSFGYDVSVMPDRQWLQISPNIKLQCITTLLQDAILLIDVCGKLFINLNDSGARDCARYISRISRQYRHSYVMALTGYGDADMINIFDESGRFKPPRAASKPSVGKQLNEIAKLTGARTVVPFSSFHQYQRADSVWAQQYTTPLEAYGEGLSDDIEYIPPFCTIDCNDLSVDHYDPPAYGATIKEPQAFDDNWSDQLDAADEKLIEEYFSSKERIQNYFGFVNFNVGGKTFSSPMRGNPERGITFSVPRNSLMTAVKYRIFDDLLIGNFMKTTLHGCTSLYEGRGNFTANCTKYGDNGLAETESEIREYLDEYWRRAGSEFLLGMLQDKSKDLIVRFAGNDSKIFNAMKSVYYRLR